MTVFSCTSLSLDLTLILPSGASSPLPLSRSMFHSQGRAPLSTPREMPARPSQSYPTSSFIAGQPNPKTQYIGSSPMYPQPMTQFHLMPGNLSWLHQNYDRSGTRQSMVLFCSKCLTPQLEYPD
ncbi:hypothetical protein BJV78DRAFT_407954 [Lactifluus subvellereus]|nr:hypothetical protein BJV78DRAFT_407954 [Lactifluus subvellereus]